jgi:hypothetical protein
MNSPFATEQARHLARRPEVASKRTPAEQIRELYRLTLGRTPSTDELQLALHFLEEGNASTPAHERPKPAQSPWRYGFGEYDEAKQQLVAFQPFAVFVSADQQFASLFQVFPAFEEIWQAGPTLPDPVAGVAHLTAAGGEPGPGPSHAVVRRWVAPADGTVRITGSLTHKIGPEYGAGIRAWIVSSRHRQLANWSLLNKSTETELPGVKVQAGDTIDFIVAGGATPFGNEFTWAPSIRLTPSDKGEQGSGSNWDAAVDFRGPHAPLLSPREQLALVLLQTDEVVFID